jgi:hypothetical protein
VKYLWILVVLAGCNPYLTQQSVAPPGRQARLDEVSGFWGVKHYRLAISEGIALAVTCEKGRPCENVTVVSANPAIAEVRPASLAALEVVGVSDPTPVSAFVVIGKSPGKTRLRLRSKEGKRDVYVSVVAPPPVPRDQAVARESAKAK